MTAGPGVVRIGIRCTSGERAIWDGVIGLLNGGLQGYCSFQPVWYNQLAEAPVESCRLYCLSMIPDLSRPEADWSQLEAEWRHAAAVLREQAAAHDAVVFVTTISRYTSARDHAVLALLRRLNLLAARLSQEFGLLVIDVDRMIAHTGAVNLDADARLSSTVARQFVIDLIVETLLNVGLDHVLEPTAIQSASSWHLAHRATAGVAAPTFVGQLRRSSVKGHNQAFLTGAHDVYGGIRSMLRDLCAPRRGLGWRMPLMLELLRVVSGRLSARIIRQRS